MLKKLLLAAGLLCWAPMLSQDCPDLLTPIPGSTGVAVTATLSWESVVGVPGYIIDLGTTPGGSDILSESVGGATSFTPPRGLPEDTLIYVTITLFFFNQPNIVCDSFSFRTEDVVVPPNCTLLTSPLDGSSGIPVASSIRWAYSPTATGYRIAIGTSLGGSEILPLTDVGNTLVYDPPADFDEETDIYVLVIPYNENGDATSCEYAQFQTGALASLPTCTSMVYPANGEGNVPLSPILEWGEVPGADGYLVSIGTSPFDFDILEDGIFFTNSTSVIEFDPNSIYYIRIVPFNTAGEALDCGPVESFSTILGCGPFIEPVSGDVITLNPELNFPETIGICEGDSSSTVSATDPANGYRWYVIESPGRERLLSEGPDFDIPGEGIYLLEIYDNLSGPGGNFECSTFQEFSVTQSSSPQLVGTDVQLGAGVIQIQVEVSGEGDYEYALNDPSGPYQDSNTFSNLPLDTYLVYVRDKNGCGTLEVIVEPDLTLEGFPKFFTPNGDGSNDLWQFILPPSGINPIRSISIFDRYGNLLAQVDPNSSGWDGTSNGRPVPPSDYWFHAVNSEGQAVRGHFTLKR
jgi:gliding motility-associated-like protein